MAKNSIIVLHFLQNRFVPNKKQVVLHLCNWMIRNATLTETLLLMLSVQLWVMNRRVNFPTMHATILRMVLYWMPTR